MLILSRRRGEAIVIGGDIQIRVTRVRGQYIDIGINAPLDKSIHRAEIYEKIQREKAHRNECVDADCPCKGG